MALLAPVRYDTAYNRPYFSGVATADPTLVPGAFPVAINGRPYILNTNRDEIEAYRGNFLEDSLPLLRDQSDQADQPGEQSLSPAQYWRRAADTWTSGGGQSMYDRNDSDRARFNASLGINPWTRYQLTLLNDTSRIRSSANTGLVAATANAQFYVADGTSVVGTANLSAFTAVTGLPAAQAVDMCSDGALVYAAYGASGIYSINGSVGTSYVTGTVSHVGFVKGRLLAANNGALYNPVAAGALPAALITIATTGWVWTAFCEGDTQIYAAGGAGDTSRVYRVAAQPDGTALGVPIVAATLPKGEMVRSLLGYLGFVVVGTDKGLRFATADSSTGDLTLGALIPTAGAVQCLDAADRFVWFGWSNYDGTHTGLGRMDLSTITAGQAPAYATDVMAVAAGVVRGVGAIGGRHVFTVDGSGIWAETNNVPVASGTFTTGQIAYGIADPKYPLAVDLKHVPLTTGQSISVSLSSDRGTFTALGSSASLGTVSPTSPIGAGNQRCEEMELQFTLTAGAGVSPTLNRWVLLAYPAPQGASLLQLPLVLAEKVVGSRNQDYSMAPAAEYAFLRSLNTSREIINVQVGTTSFQGVLEDFTWVPERFTHDQNFWNGTFIAKVRRIT